ncbi:hypothetical protein [Halalkalibacter okhensis]|uniref:Uncharacterized protein n=1 Tax=Halalkalibacter okhensis TaxID=333138 RepID=A0A0B0IAI0_9BACI|nr:hypothetical protein [Halalkalibacter okhensis]KHF39573.1 hypothetical protein LQ50_14095 [Halalkalibacter okhensis]
MFVNAFPVAYPSYGHRHMWQQPVVVHPGHYYYPGYHYGPNHYQWPDNKPHHEALAKQKPTLKKKSLHDYHWQHGYAFGQGIGQFPDYYNHNY